MRTYAGSCMELHTTIWQGSLVAVDLCSCEQGSFLCCITSGGFRGGAPLFLDQTKARRTKKNYLDTGQPLISGSGSGTDFCLLSWSFLTMLTHSKTAVQNSHHITFKNDDDFHSFTHETQRSLIQRVQQRLIMCHYSSSVTIRSFLRYLIGHLGYGGKSKGGWGQALPPTPIWPMLRVVTDETDKIRQGKFFCLGRIVLVEGLPYRVLRTHPKLGVPVKQSRKFSRYRGRLPISGPYWFYQGCD